MAGSDIALADAGEPSDVDLGVGGISILVQLIVWIYALLCTFFALHIF